MYNFENDLAAAVREIMENEGKVIEEIRFCDVKKNNGVTLRAMNIREEGKCVTPNIYIDNYYDKIETERSIEEVAEEIVDIYVKALDDAPIDNIGSDISNWEFAKDRLKVKLLKADGNEEYLGTTIWRKFLDLAIVPVVVLGDNDEGVASVVISESLAKTYGKEPEEIIDLAIASSNGKNEFKSMRDVLMESMGGMSDDMFPEDEDQMMYVLTNKNKTNGACAMLDTALLASLAELVESDLYILPSSIHELIAVNGARVESADDLRKMVRDVNDTQLAPSEILSYNVYKYDRETGTVTIA